MVFLKRLLLWGLIGALIYSLLSFHIIFFNWDEISFLKKSRLTLRYTFYMAGGKSGKNIMSIDQLRRAGIGDLLVEEGKITEEEKEFLLDKYAEEDEIYRREQSNK